MGQASTSPGWYPDPFGSASNFRWWNGTGWTVACADTLWAPEPDDPAAYVPPPRPSPPTEPGPLTVEVDDPEPRSRRGLRLTAIALAAVLVVSAGVVWLGAGQRTMPDAGPEHAGPRQPSGEQPAPGQGLVGQGNVGGADHHAGDGAGDRVASGPLSFRDPGPSWKAAGDWVLRENLSREHGMVATTEPAYQPGHDWQASIVAGDLPASISTDGSLRQVTQRAARWFTRTEWDAEPSSDPSRGRPIRVDGRPAWALTTRVAYDIDGVRATYDDIEVVVIDYGPDEKHGLLIASVPNTDRQLWRDVQQAVSTVGRTED